MKFATIHLRPEDHPSKQNPVETMLLLSLLLTLKDRASTIYFWFAGPEESKLAYLVDNEWHDLEPMPAEFADETWQTVHRWLVPNRFLRDWATRLRNWAARIDCGIEISAHPFMLIVGPSWSLWGVSRRKINDQSSLQFDLLDCTEWSREQAVRILNELANRHYPGIDDVLEAPQPDAAEG